MFKFNSIFLIILVCFSQIACQTIRRPLSEKEKAIKMAQGNQETSLSLYNNCKEKAKLESFYHIDDARIRAVEIGANTAQIIYATNYAYDVKFWVCK